MTEDSPSAMLGPTQPQSAHPQPAHTPWVFIPARLGSSRLPHKPLLDLAGRPLIARVTEAVTRVVSPERVVVVSDSQRVLDASQTARVNLTHTALINTPCVSGSERVARAHQELTASGVISSDITEKRGDLNAWVINVQGDEPLIPSDSLTRLIGALAWFERRGVEIVTLATPLSTQTRSVAEVRADHDAVKACLTQSPDPTRPELREALYFTRAASGDHLHIGVYALHTRALPLVYEPRGSLAQLEDLEQLAWMERGARIGVVCLDGPHPSGVDTLMDLERTRAAYINISAQ